MGETRGRGKDREKNEEKQAMTPVIIIFIAILVLIGILLVIDIILEQLGFFRTSPDVPISTGFAKIKPQLSGTGMRSNGTFIGVLTNGVGTMITLRSIMLKNTATGVICQLRPSQTEVAAGENFNVEGVGCGGGNPGDIYSVQIDIEYNITLNGVTTKHSEAGTIRELYG